MFGELCGVRKFTEPGKRFPDSVNFLVGDGKMLKNVNFRNFTISIVNFQEVHRFEMVNFLEILSRNCEVPEVHIFQYVSIAEMEVHRIGKPFPRFRELSYPTKFTEHYSKFVTSHFPTSSILSIFPRN